MKALRGFAPAVLLVVAAAAAAVCACAATVRGAEPVKCSELVGCANCTKARHCVWCDGDDVTLSSSASIAPFCTDGGALGPKAKAHCYQYQWLQCKCLFSSPSFFTSLSPDVM